jgi:WGR domain
MTFLRKLFGEGRDDGRDDRDDGSDAMPPGPDGEPTPPPELGPRTYLEFVGGSASKFYATMLEEHAEGWRVWFNFGRIGYPRDWAEKVDGVGESKARRVYGDLIGEKLRKGYEVRPWPASLALPSGERISEPSEPAPSGVRGIYVAAAVGELPSGAASVANLDLPPGMLLTPEDEGGPRGPAPVMWVTERPVKNVVERWSGLARVFGATGLWPLIVEPSHGIDRMHEVLMDIPRSTGATHSSSFGDGGTRASPARTTTSTTRRSNPSGEHFPDSRLGRRASVRRRSRMTFATWMDTWGLCPSSVPRRSSTRSAGWVPPTTI